MSEHTPGGAPTSPSSFHVDSANSAVLVEARSSVGPIELATSDLSGEAAVVITNGALDVDSEPSAVIQMLVSSLRSGNPVYDAEVHRRLDARRYPTIQAQLRSVRELAESRWAMDGDLTIHGNTRTLSGSAEVKLVGGNRLVVIGAHVIDIRDFSISLPSTLMLRIYPDVMVRFRIEAEIVGRDEG